eukprot:6553391-Pyramimonas_sp.AAC.1
MNHFYYHAGHSASSNGSCGVTIGLHAKRYKPQYVIRVAAPKGRLKGRGLMIRYRRGKGKGAAAYQRTVSQELSTWLHEQMNRLPSRCVPIIGTDLNSTCGADYMEPSISGDCEEDKHGVNYGIVGPTLTAHNMAMANTFYEAGVTYYGIADNVRKRIDFIIVPRAILQNTQECMVAWRKGKALQHIRCAGPKDHYPVVLSFFHSYERVHQQKGPRKPNAEACNAMLLYGYQRERFIQQVEAQLQAKMELFEQWEFEGNVDMINAGMMQCIDRVARAQLRDTPGYTEK